MPKKTELPVFCWNDENNFCLVDGWLEGRQVVLTGANVESSRLPVECLPALIDWMLEVYQLSKEKPQ